MTTDNEQIDLSAGNLLKGMTQNIETAYHGMKAIAARWAHDREKLEKENKELRERVKELEND